MLNRFVSFPIRMLSGCAVILGLLILTPSQAGAQAKAQTKQPDQPMVLINGNSVDGLLNDVKYVFRSAGKNQYGALVQGLLATVGGLKGMDRSQPVGAMVYLNTGDNPEPSIIAYFPLTNIKDLQSSIRLGPIQLKAVEGKPNRYSLLLEDQQLEAVVQGEYLFFAQNEALLNRTFPDPVQLAKSVKNYDLSASLLLSQMPQELLNQILDYMRAQIAEDSKQRPGENDDEYAGRKFATEQIEKFVTKLLLQGNRVTAGWNLSEDEKHVRVEATIDAPADSELTGLLNQMMGKNSQVEPRLTTKAPLTGSVNLAIEKPFRKLLLKQWAQGEQQALQNVPPEDRKLVERFFATLRATIDSPAYDLGVELVGEPPETFAVLGGVKVAQAKEMQETLNAIVTKLDTVYNLPNINANVAEHLGHKIHRITPDKNDIDDNAKQIFGDEPYIYVTIAHGSLWAAFGTEPALAQIKKKIEAADATSSAKPRVARVELNALSWLGLIPEADADPELVKIATKAFSRGGGTATLEFGPSKTGAELRVQLEEGFIRLAGLLIAKGIEDSLP